MIDLTRRNFIKNVGFVGTTTLLCGSSVLAQNSFTSFFDSENKEQAILSQFAKKTYAETFSSDASLMDCYQKAILSWQKTGYEPTGNFCYSTATGELKMFPMHLEVAGSGKLDAVLLCFGQNDKGEWKALKSLSGFDLEAINVAMTALKAKNNSVDLTHYLLPAPNQQSKPYSFDTQKGTVFLKTTLSSGQTATKIVVTEGNNIVYQKELVSKHRLFVNSVLV